MRAGFAAVRMSEHGIYCFDLGLMGGEERVLI